MKPLGARKAKEFDTWPKASRARENIGPLNQCEHRRMRECHPKCGHWSCPDCDLSFDEEAGR